MERQTISIITINYNNKSGLIKTIKSVISQTYSNYEYIVIDGGSKDGSYDVLKEFDQYIDFWVSEPDKGIYNAMNKGVKFSTGDYCIFMNSGDTFFDKNVLSSVFSTNYNEDIISGIAHVGSKKWLPIKKTDISLFQFFIGGLCHQATFIKKDLLLKKPYDESQPIVGDSKFFIETLIINNHTYIDINKNVCIYELGGISNDSKRQREEIIKIFNELFPQRIVKDYIAFTDLFLLRKLNPIMKKLKTIKSIIKREKQ